MLSNRSYDSNLSHISTVTKKSLNKLSESRQVSIQEAMHEIAGLDLVVCSDYLTDISLDKALYLRKDSDTSLTGLFSYLKCNIFPALWPAGAPTGITKPDLSHQMADSQRRCDDQNHDYTRHKLMTCIVEFGSLLSHQIVFSSLCIFWFWYPSYDRGSSWLKVYWLFYAHDSKWA